ncbi:SGNH/GDSL hydrolase family protein [Paludisphaera mucosa]|uniref:SGNH/GDSL hydrolase family protein n=1 Tax=Paludisphaera mucosa TaxID=3030827 RepID=A0ABT6FK23_9BACT|nr:SGNH/GDSL hydrolase family protein [Paludisphaera mucosa]MDG3007932.1 SGNH/GDSL hydrolase family protein [Paludisphaera mucosa]
MTSPAEDVSTPASPRRISRRRRWLFRIVTLLAVAGAQEALFRVLFPLPEVLGFNRIHYQQMAQSHPQIGKAMERGLVYDRLLIDSRPDGFAEVHNLNLYGFRGPDFRIAPTPGRRRILVIGDSAVEGEGVDDSATITAEWSRLLARDGTAAEVINLGVIAASLPHLWILTRDAVALLRPTDVVVALYPNDLPAPADERSFDSPAPRFAPNDEAFRRPRLAVLVDRALYEKPIHRRWPHLPIRFFAPVPDGTNPWSSKARPDALKDELYQDMKAGRLNPWLYHQSRDMPRLLTHDFAAGGSPREFLARMEAVCRSVGAGMMVAYTPFCGVVHPRYAPALVELGMDRDAAAALAVDPRFRSQNRVLAEVCDDLGLPLADATADLVAAEAAGTPQYWPYDTHPDARGYATIARRLHLVWKASRPEASKPSPPPGAAP